MQLTTNTPSSAAAPAPHVTFSNPLHPTSQNVCPPLIYVVINVLYKSSKIQGIVFLNRIQIDFFLKKICKYDLTLRFTVCFSIFTFKILKRVPTHAGD